jgi:Trk K+ transport system NAD-binding subunit
VRPFAPLTDTENTFEAEIGFLSILEGKRLSESNLPEGVRILTVERNGHVFVASGETILRAGDRLTISGPRSQSGLVIDLLSGK